MNTIYTYHYCIKYVNDLGEMRIEDGVLTNPAPIGLKNYERIRKSISDNVGVKTVVITSLSLLHKEEVDHDTGTTD